MSSKRSKARNARLYKKLGPVQAKSLINEQKLKKNTNKGVRNVAYSVYSNKNQVYLHSYSESDLISYYYY